MLARKILGGGLPLLWLGLSRRRTLFERCDQRRCFMFLFDVVLQGSDSFKLVVAVPTGERLLLKVLPDVSLKAGHSREFLATLWTLAHCVIVKSNMQPQVFL